MILLIFSPSNINEFIKNNTISQNVNFLIGRIDLIVIDSAGNAHVIDYKTSPKPYVKYNEAKKLGYTYQLATYTRILAQNGVRFNGIRSFVAPIQLEGFRTQNEEFVFDNIKSDTVLDELTDEIRTREKVINNLNEVISVPENLTATSENLITNVDKSMKILFPNWGKKKSEEELSKIKHQPLQSSQKHPLFRQTELPYKHYTILYKLGQELLDHHK